MDKEKVAQEILAAAQQLTAAEDFTDLTPQERKRVLDEYDKRVDGLSKLAHEYQTWWQHHDIDIKSLFKQMYPKSSSQKINEYQDLRDAVIQAMYDLALSIGKPISDMPEEG